MVTQQLILFCSFGACLEFWLIVFFLYMVDSKVSAFVFDLQVKEGESESLPQVYDPDTIAAYWSKRPGAVATRIAQLLSVAGGFLSGIAADVITKKLKEVSYFNL